MDGSTPICYYRANVLEFTDPCMRMKWVPFIIDKAFNEVKEPHMAGMLQFRLYMHHVTKDGEFPHKTHKAWKDLPPKRQDAFKLRAYIY